MQRSPSTISRELQRNCRLEGEGYRSADARALHQHRRRGARPAPRLQPDLILLGVVCHFLRLRWSPRQIALTPARLHPKGHGHRVSHKTIYNWIYAMSVGKIRKDLIACPRQAHNKRLRRSKGQDRRGQIPEMLSIHLRPPEIEDRQFPGHWEGDLIKGAVNVSAVGTLVERTSRLLMLVKLPEIKSASTTNVLQAFTDELLGIAEPMRLSMTYDQGREMALHKTLSERTSIAVYFCDLHGPWQQGFNENMNGLVRQYLPKGTDLSGYSQVQLDAIADEINGQPRQGLGVRSPLAVYRELLISSSQHFTVVH